LNGGPEVRDDLSRRGANQPPRHRLEQPAELLHVRRPVEVCTLLLRGEGQYRFHVTTAADTFAVNRQPTFLVRHALRHRDRYLQGSPYESQPGTYLADRLIRVRSGNAFRSGDALDEETRVAEFGPQFRRGLGKVLVAFKMKHGRSPCW